MMVCTAASQLCDSLKNYDTDHTFPIAENSHFLTDKSTYSTVKRTLMRYKGVLGASLLLSLFSHIKSCFFSVLDEIIDFHGGFEEI